MNQVIEQLRKETSIITKAYEGYDDLLNMQYRYENLKRAFVNPNYAIFRLLGTYVLYLVALSISAFPGVILTMVASPIIMPLLNSKLSAVGSIISLILLIVGFGIGYVTIYKKYLSNWIYKKGWAVKGLQRATQEVENKQLDIRTELIKNQVEFQLIPPRYRFPLAAQYILQLHSENRINSMPEALNQTDKYLHNLSMQQGMRDIYNAQMLVISSL